MAFIPLMMGGRPLIVINGMNCIDDVCLHMSEFFVINLNGINGINGISSVNDMVRETIVINGINDINGISSINDVCLHMSEFLSLSLMALMVLVPLMMWRETINRH